MKEGITFEEEMNTLVKELKGKVDESRVLDEKIIESLRNVGFDMKKI